MTEVVNNGEGLSTKTDTGEEGTTDQLTAEQIADLRAKAELAEKLEAENGSLKRDLKEAQKAKEEPQKAKEKDPQTNEPDYSKIAYLNSLQITNADDQKSVMDEAERLKLPLTDVLNMEHMKAKLKTAQNERAVKDGMPDGTGRTGEGHKGQVEYYLQHPDEVPDDLELHNKVIDARMNKETNANKFSPIKFIG